MRQTGRDAKGPVVCQGRVSAACTLCVWIRLEGARKKHRNVMGTTQTTYLRKKPKKDQINIVTRTQCGNSLVAATLVAPEETRHGGSAVHEQFKRTYDQFSLLDD